MITAAEKFYRDFIEQIDCSVAGRDPEGRDLRWHVACSAETNAGDSLSAFCTHAEFYETALANAKMILDDWKSFYPQLRIKACAST